MVAKFLDPNTPSWQRRSFALLNDGRKVWATVLFLSAVIHRKVVHVNFFVFFLQYLQYHGLLRSRNFATMATWRNDFFSLLAYKRQGVVVRLPRKYWPEAGIFDVRKYLAAILFSQTGHGVTLVKIDLYFHSRLWLKPLSSHFGNSKIKHLFYCPQCHEHINSHD